MSHEGQKPESIEGNLEKIKSAVTHRLINKIESALLLFKQARGLGEDTDFVECLKKVWPENDGAPWQRKPRFSLPDLDPQLTIKFDLSAEYDETAHAVTLNILDLRNAQTDEQFERGYMCILENVYHEVEHAYNPEYKGHNAPDGIEETIHYLADQGEIEAFGRQFAFRYIREYPSEPYIEEKMIELSKKIRNSNQSSTAYNYFITFADPEKQKKYGKFGNIVEIHTRILEATNKHFTILTRESQL